MLRRRFQSFALVGCSLWAAGSLASAVFAQNPAAGGPRPSQTQLVDIQMRAMPGNEKTWYVINTQDNQLVSSNVGRKVRGHIAIQGKQAAAQYIVDFWTAGGRTYRKFNFEVYKTQADAEARVSYWREYDWRAGYR